MGTLSINGETQWGTPTENPNVDPDPNGDPQYQWGTLMGNPNLIGEP